MKIVLWIIFSCLTRLDLTNSNSLASVNVEVCSELVDPFSEFFFTESFVSTGIFIGGFFNPFPVIIGWNVVSGPGESFESLDEFLSVNLSVIVGVNSVEDGLDFSWINAVLLNINLDGRDDSDGGDKCEFHL